MKITVTNFPEDIAKIDPRTRNKFSKVLNEGIDQTLKSPSTYKLSWSEYLDLSDIETLNLLVEQTNYELSKNEKTEPKPKPVAVLKNKPKTPDNMIDQQFAKILPLVRQLKRGKVFLSKAEQKLYDKNEDKNYHTENVLYLAELNKRKSLIEAAKLVIQLNKEVGHTSTKSANIQKLILSKMDVVYFVEKVSVKPVAKPKANPLAKVEAKMQAQQSKKEELYEKLKAELTILQNKVQANSKFKDKIGSALNNFMTKQGLAGLGSTVDENIVRVKGKIKFYKNLMRGDLADFKAITKKIGYTYRITSVNKPKEKSLKEVVTIIKEPQSLSGKPKRKAKPKGIAHKIMNFFKF